MLNWIGGLLGVVLMVYLAFGAWLYVAQERLMFVPGEVPPPTGETEAPELRPVTTTTEDGLDLVSWYAPPPKDGGAVVVYFHGNAGNLAGRAYKARALLDAGLGVLLVGYRGYNGNPGQPGQAGFRLDGLAVLDFLEGEGFGPDRRVFYGESIGSGTALPLAVERGAAAVVLEGAFSSMVAMGRHQYPVFPIFSFLIRHPFDNVSAAHALSAPLLILHGANDDLVPPAMAHRLAEAARAGGNDRVTLVIHPQAGHVDLFDHGASATIIDMLKDVLPDAGIGGPQAEG
jgi:fermentation-respiration switch protein FrsA (DUF1100 family)